MLGALRVAVAAIRHSSAMGTPRRVMKSTETSLAATVPRAFGHLGSVFIANLLTRGLRKRRGNLMILVVEL